MCQYITRLYPCGYQSPIMMLRSCDSDWKPAGTPRKPRCPLVEKYTQFFKSNLEKIKMKDSNGWDGKGAFCEGYDRDECKIRRACFANPKGPDYSTRLEAYREVKKILLGEGEEEN
ncbi:hypothetical protein QC764_301433 [Podospora pseudoanserina]|uniref:Uncharacterized protein n=1 Tax=Podospora pseudoanserina TaxID=2609844 RepID=A0ABR0ID21_9PEZI|nr:hypothetical protein QC764_301433 [Podospora pseudoanserina]